MSDSDAKSDDGNAENHAGGKDKRRAPRRQAGIPAHVSDRERKEGYDCVICNIAKGGCLISSASIHKLPEQVLIKITQVDNPIKGRVVWRKKDKAGIEFERQKPETL
ncbi:MAG: PilZ domain-containing protein [Methyloligellaceae bacterium]